MTIEKRSDIRPVSGMRSPITRRSALKGFGAAALAGAAASSAPGLGWAPAQAADAVSLVSWASAGQRWEFAQKGVYPLFEKKYPNINIQFVAEPVADMLPKTAIAMASKSDRYDIIQEDYMYVPQFLNQRALEPLEPYLDKDPAYKKDILADIPENVLDLYRDKPAAQGGILYGLPDDSNTQLQYYRKDAFEKAGIKSPAETWEDAIAIAKQLSEDGRKKVVGMSLKRGAYAGTTFMMILRSFGGDLFDKMEPGGWKPTLDSEPGHKALDVLTKLLPFCDPTTLNASDDEANTAMLNGTWLFTPVTWGGSSMNDPAFTKYADVWSAAVVPKGSGPNGRHSPHMGGHGLIVPAFSHHKDEAWEWVKFICSGDKQDPAIGKAFVEHTGQPARLSLLKEYANVRPYFLALMQSLPTAMRFIPIPESSNLYEVIGTEVAAVAIGSKSSDQALKDMQGQVRRIMTRSGYYKG